MCYQVLNQNSFMQCKSPKHTCKTHINTYNKKVQAHDFKNILKPNAYIFLTRIIWYVIFSIYVYTCGLISYC